MFEGNSLIHITIVTGGYFEHKFPKIRNTIGITQSYYLIQYEQTKQLHLENSHIAGSGDICFLHIVSETIRYSLIVLHRSAYNALVSMIIPAYFEWQGTVE